MWKEAIVALLKAHPAICLDELGKITKNLSQAPGQDLNPVPPEYEALDCNIR
jgi:hypothetical protein